MRRRCRRQGSDPRFASLRLSPRSCARVHRNGSGSGTPGSNRDASGGCGKRAVKTARRGPAPERRYSEGGMSDKYERLLDHLVQSEGWVTASELADQLGVTTRSVRSYVTAAKAAAHPLPIISASTSGYFLNREAYATFASGARAKDSDFDPPRDRVHHLVRRLTEAPDGLDIHDLADSLFVSESTIESDLRKVKALGD